MTEIKKLVLNVDNTSTNYIRADLVEEREAELLGQLEVSEETVDVLEQLLVKYAEEVQRLRIYNDLLRKMPATSEPFPPIAPTQPWVWPPRVGDLPPTLVTFLQAASEEVDKWPQWKKDSFGTLFGGR